MARAHTIWIVRDIADGYRRDPIGAFSVKHELLSWLASEHTDPYGYTITVVRDGNLKYANPQMEKWEVFPETVDAQEFLDKERKRG